MNCPRKKRDVRPSLCLTCEHCGGLNNGGVLCYKANRKLTYDLEDLRMVTNPLRRAQ